MKILKTLKYKAILVGSVAVFSGVYASYAHAAYDKNYIGDMEEYVAVYEDTLVHLARKHDMGFVEIRAANPTLDPWIPGEGAKVILPKRHLLPDAPREGIVINLPEMRIYAYLNGDDAPYTYPIGVGREGLDTPTGKTSVVRKKEGPTWHPTKRMLEEDPKLETAVPPGPDNPLGTHALYLGWPTYAMHGTNRPFGIGRRVSSGCIRLYPEDITRLFEQVPVGTKVNVVNQPIKVVWIGNELYLEAHPDLEQAIKMEEMGLVEQQKFTDEDMAYIVEKAGEHVELLNWPKIRTTLRKRKGYPVRIARYFVEGDAADTSESQKKEDVAEAKDAIEPQIKSKNTEGVEKIVKPKEKPEAPKLEEKAVIIPPVKPSQKGSDKKKG
jgi:L,D-transpeptidase ErfK/SrfK